MDADRRADYVERWARTLEAQGESRIAGRIYAHLATAAEPHLSLQELADQLAVSRASISTNTRRLIEIGLIARVPVPGSRGENYAADPEASRSMIERTVALARALEELSAEGVALQPKAITPGAQSLRLMTDLYGEIADALERAAKRRAGRRRSS